MAGPSANELQRLVEQIAVVVGQALERRGLIERDIENTWLAPDNEAGPLDDLIGHSITYRIAVGPRAAQRLFTLQTVPPRLQGPEGDADGAARAGGFSLHAGLDIAPQQREKLERLCRYVSRSPVAAERLALSAPGQVRYTLKTPYWDGTTHTGSTPASSSPSSSEDPRAPRAHGALAASAGAAARGAGAAGASPPAVNSKQ